MIEEIATPVTNDLLKLLSIIIPIIGGLCICYILIHYNKPGWVITIIYIACVIIGLSFFMSNISETTSIINEWEDQVNQQVASLNCKDLEEAYHIYKMEFIKEKFLFECVDTREMWWK